MKRKLSLKHLIFSVMITIISLFTLTSGSGEAYSQCQPFIKIDGNIVVANENVPSGVKFPIWLKAGQTVACGPSVASVSAIEFTENGASLEYSQVISITSQSPVTIQAGKVWKIESVIKHPLVNNLDNKMVFTSDMGSSNTFKVPSCSEFICIEAWGGGGGGQANKNTSPYSGGAGGGGGSYAQGCFAVQPGATYTVTVGGGGAGGASNSASGSTGGASSVGSLISAGGGAGGSGGTSGGGAGGTSTAPISLTGFNGKPADASSGTGGDGGYGANGGPSGKGGSGAVGNKGTEPGGGGGGGGSWGSTLYGGGAGASGKVIIYW